MICQLVDIEYCPGTPTVVQKVSLTSPDIIAARATCNSCITSYVERLTLFQMLFRMLTTDMVVRCTTIR